MTSHSKTHEIHELLRAIMSTKIVAFLQNPWFPPGTAERHIIAYRDDQKFHRRLLEGTMSGRRLRTALGDLFDTIHWDNTNWRSAEVANGIMEPDPLWMLNVIRREKPEIVLCFGNQAQDTMDQVLKNIFVMSQPLVMDCHHPNARHRTQADLDEFALRVRQKSLELELIGRDNPHPEEDL